MADVWLVHGIRILCRPWFVSVSCPENGHGHKCDLVIVSLGVILKLFYISNLLGERTDFSLGKTGL